jgi:hypothetical protein
MDMIFPLIKLATERGLRREQAETYDLQQQGMKDQQKLISLNIKEKQQMIDALDKLPPEYRTAPPVLKTLMWLTNRGMMGQEQQPMGGYLPPAEGGIGGGFETPQAQPVQPGLTGQIAGKQLGLEQMGGMGNIIKDILLKQGIGKSREVRSWQTLQHPETGEWVRVPTTMFGSPVWQEAQPAPPELGTQAIERTGGEKAVILFDKLRGFVPGQPGYIQTAPPTMEKPIKETGLPLWVHPETLESPAAGMSPKEAEGQGYRRVSTEAKNRIDAAKGMKEVLTKLGDLMNQVFPKHGGLGERMRGAPSRLFGARTQYSPAAAQLESFINGTVAPIIRSFGEKGNLSETDVKRAINLMPKITDSADVAWGKFNNLIDLINNIQRSAIGGKPSMGLKPGKKLEDPLGLR